MHKNTETAMKKRNIKCRCIEDMFKKHDAKKGGKGTDLLAFEFGSIDSFVC